MNKARRKELRDALTEFMNSYSEAKDKLVEKLESVRDEEQEAYDNLPESLQYGEKGESMEECISAIEDAISELEEDPSFIDELYESCGVEINE